MASLLSRSVTALSECNILLQQIRCYARGGVSRRPRRVLTEEQFVQLEKTALANKQTTFEIQEEPKVIKLDPSKIDYKPTKTFDTQRPHKSSKATLTEPLISAEEIDSLERRKATSTKKANYKLNKDIKEPKQTFDMLETVIDDNGDFIYTKLKNKDPTVGSMLSTIKIDKQRAKLDMAMFEGKRLIKDALIAKCQLKSLLFSRKSDVEELKQYLPRTGAKLYKMPYKEIQMWSELTTSPGLIGLFKTPEVDKYVPKYSLPITIICDNIREPGNLGAILRTAAGVGVESVILTNGCVNLWEPKVLRSACGSHFHLKILNKMDWYNVKKYLSEKNSAMFIADNAVISESRQENQEDQNDDEKLADLSSVLSSMPLLPYCDYKYDNLESIALIIGGETEGISENSYRLAAQFGGIRLNVPMCNDIESLNTNTAFGVIAFEMKRQLEKTVPQVQDNKIVVEQ